MCLKSSKSLSLTILNILCRILEFTPQCPRAPGGTEASEGSGEEARQREHGPSKACTADKCFTSVWLSSTSWSRHPVTSQERPGFHLVPRVLSHYDAQPQRAGLWLWPGRPLLHQPPLPAAGEPAVTTTHFQTQPQGARFHGDVDSAVTPTRPSTSAASAAQGQGKKERSWGNPRSVRSQSDSPGADRGQSQRAPNSGPPHPTEGGAEPSTSFVSAPSNHGAGSRPLRLHAALTGDQLLPLSLPLSVPLPICTFHDTSSFSQSPTLTLSTRVSQGLPFTITLSIPVSFSQDSQLPVPTWLPRCVTFSFPLSVPVSFTSDRLLHVSLRPSSLPSFPTANWIRQRGWGGNRMCGFQFWRC